MKINFLKKNFLENWYPQILAEFKYDPFLDLEAAKLLAAMLTNPALVIKKFKSKIAGRLILIVAPGPSLETSLGKLKPLLKDLKSKLIIIAVDGALTALIENKLNPHILVTDLDGFKIEFLNQTRRMLIAVHAHGDNIDKIKNYPVRFLSRTLGTCQADFDKNILNIGGFTDGDRAVCLCECFEAETVFLLGMDFGYTVGRYSKPYLNSTVKASLVKRRKMVYAMNIIKELVFNSDIKYYCLLQSSELDSIPVMKLEEFKNYIK